ncbi:hypothetical protein J437_LFUL018851 [Ladona fulva]|uniref:Metaxin-2 n=1 Tax=Ladona fulva TaxID=123851 RepID=A0A8K0KQ51_LADFU|nr:hypothetical protein J437_LFUL018851 [Ladona fulva]
MVVVSEHISPKMTDASPDIFADDSEPEIPEVSLPEENEKSFVTENNLYDIPIKAWSCKYIAEDGEAPFKANNLSSLHLTILTMPSVRLQDSFVPNEESWQDDIRLYEPFEVEQVLLTDFANCLAVQAYLKMCNLNFNVEMRSNAEFMSPSSQVPFIKCGLFVVSELDPIVAFFAHKEVSLSNDLDDKSKGDMRAYMSLVNTVLTNAEQYVLWNVPDVLNSVTKPRYGCVYPWPLNSLLCWRKRRQCLSRLKVYGWLSKSLSEVYEEVHKPTELDALVFGHVFTLMSTPLPDNRLASTVRNFPELTNLSNRIEREYFANSEHMKALSDAANAAV